jgi:hypothetical protein
MECREGGFSETGLPNSGPLGHLLAGFRASSFPIPTPRRLREVGGEDLLFCVFLLSRHIDSLLERLLFVEFREQRFSETRGCQGIREEKCSSDRKGA